MAPQICCAVHATSAAVVVQGGLSASRSRVEGEGGGDVRTAAAGAEQKTSTTATMLASDIPRRGAPCVAAEACVSRGAGVAPAK